MFAVSAASVFAQLPAPNDSGVSTGHIHLIVNDPDAQKKVWVDALGAQVTKAGALEMLKLPGVFIVVGKARTAPAGGSDGSTVNHFGFLMKSYADINAKLVAANVALPTDRADRKQMIAEFPEGVRVEFIEDANISTPLTFHHIHIGTTDQESLRAWYVKTFGAKAGKRGDYPSAVVPGGEVDFRKEEKAMAATKGRSLDHIGFEVKGLEAFCKKLQADGVQFDMAYREMPQLDGLKIAFILDPVGTRIELTEGLASH